MNSINTKIKKINILGLSKGEPFSTKTYSGVPYSLYSEFRNMNVLSHATNNFITRPADFLKGYFSYKNTLRHKRRVYNPYFRYQQKNIDMLSDRFQKLERLMPDHDAIVQFGVGPLPLPSKKLITHVELTIPTVLNSPVFSQAYGFLDYPDKIKQAAILGEQYFLNHCDLVFTNSEWTAQGLLEQGVSPEKIKIHTPGVNMDDPGTFNRSWDKCNLLFVGKQWESKGGKILLDAFKQLRKKIPDAKLTIIGCNPSINTPGVIVKGFLYKNNPVELAEIRKCYEEATIFCMPSYWESTGIVYMEAAVYGLPVIMLNGQGRKSIFPEDIFTHLNEPCPNELCDTIISLYSDKERMEISGREGRKLILDKYTWPTIARRLYDDICDLF